MSKPTFSIANPTVPLGSTVLVTGANGLIASHAVDRLLEVGYNVRGTVRDPSRCTWMEPLFASRHPSNKFEIAQVSNFGAPGAWDAAVKGVAAVVAVAGGVGLMVSDIDKALEEEVPWNEALLQAAKNEPTVKAYIYTSSAWATFTPDQTKKTKLTEWTYNDDAIRIVRSDATPEEKGIRPYMAFKALLEQRIWEWVKKENPSYTFNSILPETVIGECLDPEHQGITSTCGMVKSLYEGKGLEVLTQLPPQWVSDTRDTGLLYAAALMTPGVDRERLYPWSDRYSWPRIAQILKELYPQKDVPVLEDNGWDQTEVPNERALELLRGLGQDRWTTLEESVKACAKGFVKD